MKKTLENPLGCSVAIALLMLATTGLRAAPVLPVCVERSASSSIESQIMAHAVPEEELLARLVYAESISTGFPEDPVVYEGIAWGVMNRVRLSEKFPALSRRYGSGVADVIFKRGQFNPAISLKSPYSREFLCPRNASWWEHAVKASHGTQHSQKNPFLQTDWERQNKVSLVVNFYYPASKQALTPYAPWENDKTLIFIGDVAMNNKILPASRIRFYRLARNISQ